MGCGVTFVCRMSGFELVAFVTSDRYTSQAWWLSSELGLCVPSLVPYHTAASRPAEPATDHGMVGVAVEAGRQGAAVGVRVPHRGLQGDERGEVRVVHLAGVVDRDLGVAASRPGVLGVGLSGVGDRRVVDGVVGPAPVLGAVPDATLDPRPPGTADVLPGVGPYPHTDLGKRVSPSVLSCCLQV